MIEFNITYILDAIVGLTLGSVSCDLNSGRQMFREKVGSEWMRRTSLRSQWIVMNLGMMELEPALRTKFLSE